MKTEQGIHDGLEAGTITKAEFYELMKMEGRKIDPRSADVTCWHAQICDPYGLGCDPEHDCVGRVYFARALGSNIWVAFSDLPEDTWRALQERLRLGKPPVTVPFNPEVERMADAIGKIYAGGFDEHGRAHALEAGQAALRALRNPEHPED